MLITTFSEYRPGKSLILKLTAIGFASFTFFGSSSALGCSVRGDLPTPQAIVAEAELIVLATAREYAISPDTETDYGDIQVSSADEESNVIAIFRVGPSSRVIFNVDEVLKGEYEEQSLVLPGLLTELDEWNSYDFPYRHVRASGSSSCFANGYRKGGQFLLMLKHVSSMPWGSYSDVDYTARWSVLGPTNEQIRSPDDPWVVWVQGQID